MLSPGFADMVFRIVLVIFGGFAVIHLLQGRFEKSFFDAALAAMAVWHLGTETT